MKKSVILDIFNGTRGSQETMLLSKDKSQALAKIFPSENELKEKLSPELYKLHQKYAEELDMYWCEVIDLYFVEGFKLGLLIGIESME